MASITTPDGNLRVELRHLSALAAIAEHSSFTRAAEHLGYTQSAVSQQIAVLERTLGTRLVIRPGGPSPVSLTRAGELVAHHARVIDARLQAIRADLDALESEPAPLSVAAYQSVGARILPAILKRYVADHPDVRVDLTESGDDCEMLRRIELGELDVGFVMLPIVDGPFSEIPLVDDHYVFVTAKGSELSGETTPLPVGELGGLDLIGHPLNTCQARVEEAIRATGTRPNIVFRSDDNPTVQGLVRAGVGHAIVPSLTVDHGDEAVVIRSLHPPIPPRRIGLVVHGQRVRSAQLQAFVQCAREESLNALASNKGPGGGAGVSAVAGP